MKNKLMYLIAMLTYSAWHPLVNMILSHCRRQGIINEVQWYAIESKLDRTQVYCQLRAAAMRELP